MPKPTRSGWTHAIPFLIILAAAGIGTVTLRDTMSFATLKAHHDALMAYAADHYALTAVAFVLAYVAVVALSLPGATICTLTGGFLFGVFPGVLFNVAAATAGAVIVFLAARYGFGDRFAARLDESAGAVRRLREGIRQNEMSFLLVMRLVPAVPFFVANLVPALLGVGVWRFALTTFIGIIPAAIIFTWVGSGLGALIAMGKMPDMAILFRPQFLGPLLGLAALALLPAVVRAWRR
ncbi:MAG: TVP38/TMEM64 family protein [Rhodobacteraceae bacterium]|nr:TVP38/TMEM64 family protein [Paracoccaceae bacterium]